MAASGSVRTGHRLETRRARSRRKRTGNSVGPIVVREGVTIARFEFARVHESYLVPLRVGAKNPGRLFHLAQGRLAAIGESWQVVTTLIESEMTPPPLSVPLGRPERDGWLV